MRRITGSEIVAQSGLGVEDFRQSIADTQEWNAARYDVRRHWMAHLWDGVCQAASNQVFRDGLPPECCRLWDGVALWVALEWYEAACQEEGGSCRWILERGSDR